MDPHIAVLGAGAVGCYFGGMLARAGVPVTFIGRAPHVEAMTRDGLTINTAQFQARIPVSATTSLEAARDAGIILYCVKTLDTETAIQALAPHLRHDAMVISLQNGVDNVERIRSATGIEAVPAVVYVAAQMAAPGTVQHNGRGDLILGADPQGLAPLFTAAGVPCRISSNIAADLWTKMIMNCAYNAMSALGRCKYGRLIENPLTRDLMRQVIEECVAVAGALGVSLSTPTLTGAAHKLGDVMSQAVSSTAQDIARGKRTEIDSLNGYVVRRGSELGVPTPVNQSLHALVKLLEESESARSANQAPQ
ncbi:MAG: ketopantoate reductase family protein [Bryobacteraceae bacterium]